MVSPPDIALKVVSALENVCHGFPLVPFPVESFPAVQPASAPVWQSQKYRVVPVPRIDMAAQALEAAV
jgi:hypothetical protein